MTQTTRNCGTTCRTDDYGNCSILGSDKLPVQCVGPWAEDKYFYLERYLAATRQARKKYSDKGNAVFIDLFTGPGICVNRASGTEIKGGALRTLTFAEAAFNENHLIDLHDGNVQSLKLRVGGISKCTFYTDDSNRVIGDLVRTLSGHRYKRYHFAFIDPFGPEQLKFSTIASLAQLDRLDLFIHFPIGAIRRNLPSWQKRGGEILDEFLGTNSWRSRLNTSDAPSQYAELVKIYMEQLQSAGFPSDGLRSTNFEEVGPAASVSVKNTQNVELYALILASKHAIGQSIWSSVIKKDRSGQRKWF